MKLTFEEACSAVADLFEAVPELWTTGCLAKNAAKLMVEPTSPEAVCWCAMGGVLSALGMDRGPRELSAKFSPAIRRFDTLALVGDFNDRYGRKAVIKMLRMAAGEL